MLKSLIATVIVLCSTSTFASQVIESNIDASKAFNLYMNSALNGKGNWPYKDKYPQVLEKEYFLKTYLCWQGKKMPHFKDQFDRHDFIEKTKEQAKKDIEQFVPQKNLKYTLESSYSRYDFNKGVILSDDQYDEHFLKGGHVTVLAPCEPVQRGPIKSVLQKTFWPSVNVFPSIKMNKEDARSFINAGGLVKIEVNASGSIEKIAIHSMMMSDVSFTITDASTGKELYSSK